MKNHMIRRQAIIDEMKAMHNHIGILADTDLVRLIGFDEDETDYYYIVTSMIPRSDGSKEYGCTYVAPFVSLKGKIERYDWMDEVFSMNGCPKTAEFKIYERDLKFPEGEENGCEENSESDKENSSKESKNTSI